MKDYFVRSFSYSSWANQQTLASLLECQAAQSDGTPLIAHLLAAEHIWVSRLSGKEPALVVWPSLTIEECQAQAAENKQSWADYFASLTDNGLCGNVEYCNSRGESFCNSVMDILTHVVVHGGYHRGQVAKIVRSAGGIVAVTDFIVFARSRAETADA